MENNRFDKLTRLVAQFTSRRAVLGGAAAGGAASALGLSGLIGQTGLVDDADAKKRHKKKGKKRQCKKDKNCKKSKDVCKKSVCKGHKCKKKNLPDGTTCGDGLECEAGSCVCPNGICVLTVRPGSLNGWVVGDDEDVDFVTGPAAPPLGIGSVELGTPDGGKATLTNSDFSGLAIADIDTLGYSTYMQDGGPTEVVVPAIKLEVTYGDEGTFTTLIYEPTYTENSNVVLDTWQDWNTLSGDARWWSSHALPTGICSFDCFVPWADILTAIPDAVIGKILVETGSGTADALGNADALAINHIVFNFEPDPQD